jgi:hypothetical protein
MTKGMAACQTSESNQSHFSHMFHRASVNYLLALPRYLLWRVGQHLHRLILELPAFECVFSLFPAVFVYENLALVQNVYSVGTKVCGHIQFTSLCLFLLLLLCFLFVCLTP